MKKVAFTHDSGQRVENARRIKRRWAIVECEHNLMILERQGVLKLHGAKTAGFRRIPRNDPACAKRARITVTLLGFGGRTSHREANQACGRQSKKHRTSPRKSTNPELGH